MERPDMILALIGAVFIGAIVGGYVVNLAIRSGIREAKKAEHECRLAMNSINGMD